MTGIRVGEFCTETDFCTKIILSRYVCLPPSLSVSLSVSLFLSLCVSLSLSLSLCLSFSVSVCLSVCLSLSEAVVVLACESLRTCIVCTWHCEHARFCVEVFYAPYVNSHSFIHTSLSLSLSLSPSLPQFLPTKGGRVCLPAPVWNLRALISTHHLYLLSCPSTLSCCSFFLLISVDGQMSCLQKQTNKQTNKQATTRATTTHSCITFLTLCVL